MNVFKIKIDRVQFRAIYGKHADGYFKTTEEVNRRVVGQISKMDFYVWAVLGSGGSRMVFFQC